MGRKKLVERRNSNIPFLCAICGDKPRGYNFSVLTCISCKSFFRRHGLVKLEMYHCRYQGDCEITQKSRSNCIHCRLRKCVQFGMDPLMIRYVRPSNTNSKQLQKLVVIERQCHSLSNPRPLNLLQNDSSLLTKDEWELVSNIIRSFDEQNIMNRVRNLLKEKSSLPLKLRLKSSDTIEYLSRTYKRVLPLLEHSPHLLSLSSNAQRTILQHNVLYTASFNGYFIGYETDSFHHPTYMSACSALFGRDFMNKYAEDGQRLLANGNLYKLLLFVLIFSSNCSIVLFDEKKKFDFTMESCHSIELFRIENIYLSILWKYLNYLYGFNESVIYFNRMIKNILDMFARNEVLLKNATFKRLADAIASQINDSLLLKQ